MAQLYSEAPRLHLERARDREGSSETAWCADYWQGECQAGGMPGSGSAKQGGGGGGGS
jgi:hypothetical protein